MALSCIKLDGEYTFWHDYIIGIRQQPTGTCKTANMCIFSDLQLSKTAICIYYLINKTHLMFHNYKWHHCIVLPISD